jgi:ubiquinone/menaquinone biosynthesis C-methylase UbiE
MNALAYSTEGGLRQRWFAWSLLRYGQRADAVLAEWKRRLFGDTGKVVLEIGAGAGVNAKYLPPHHRLMALEPNPYLRTRLSRMGVSVLGERAEQTSVPNDSVDTVISSLVLCSVTDVGAVLREIQRVLKPGGTYRFIEHVAAPSGTWLRRSQKFLTPLCICLEGGCRPARDLENDLRHSGLEVEELNRFTADLNAPLVRDFVCGVLCKPKH